MSEENKENATQGEKVRQIVISADDCRAALDFWTHFNIPIPEALSQAIEKFAVNPTVENQDLVKLEVCRAISTSDHEAFKDEMMEKIVEECAGVTFEMQFDKDLEETLTEKK